MLVNLDWLREWVEIEPDAERLADELTTAGLEVDAIIAAGGPLPGVVVAEVLEVNRHPHAERLTVCRIDDGRGQGHRTVVCGAPNVSPGIRVPYAPVGAALPDGRTIEVADLRGIVSAGMLCSAREVGLADDGSGLMILDRDARVGQTLAEHLRLNDAVLDVNITPNRGDCFSVLGIAREIAAKQGRPLRGPDLGAMTAVHEATIPVMLAAGEACPRFAGRVVKDIRPGSRSPDWLRERLRRAGLRAIHPVVDVTNYVMLELGQPLHAYSLDRLAGGITVRYADDGERIVLLDGREIELTADVLVIADEAGAVGLAGIMGGERTAVTADTRDLFFESAFFAPEALLGRARRYGLHTDASLRFERGVDPAHQERAIERATQLLQQIAAGRAGPTILTEDRANLPARPAVELRASRIEAVLGMNLPDDQVQQMLERLDMSMERRAGSWLVVPPAFRFDITIEEDLIEELARLTGYDNIPVTAGSGSAKLGTSTEQRIDAAVIADVLTARGYSEVITYSFIDAASEAAVNPGVDAVELMNPISADMSVMRRSLWPGLLRTAQQNMTRQLPRLRLFEVGRQFTAVAGAVEETGVVAGIAAGEQWPEHWDLPKRAVDFFDVKADVEALLATTGRRRDLDFVPGDHPALNPAQTAKIRSDGITVGWIGTVHPRLQKHFDLRSSAVLFSLQIERTFVARIPSFARYSKYPFVRRDLAVVIDEAVDTQTLLAQVESAAGALLQSVVIFDLYRGKGIDSRRKSVGLGLILQDVSRTLTDEDADQTVDLVMRRLEHELGATIRT
jgi:phenylalanyl-tRNA synthetase beta chain